MTILYEVVISAQKFHILNVNVYQHLMLTGKFNFSANRSNLMQAKHVKPQLNLRRTKTVRYNTRSLGNLRTA
jgi:formamidopyrimidine-DNA glycosylase